MTGGEEREGAQALLPEPDYLAAAPTKSEPQQPLAAPTFSAEPNSAKPRDALAILRALSEEEKIALFS